MADIGEIPIEGGGESEEEGNFFLKTGHIVMLSMICLFILSASLIEHIHFGYIHETGVVILIGISISLIAKFGGYSEMNQILEFNDNIFFYVWLPPLVFASGYNMKRKKFFQHFNYIALFGILGTFAWFILFSLFTAIIFFITPMLKYNPATGESGYFQCTIREILLLSSLMCSSDVVAAVSLIDYRKQAKLFSICFGEGITNDAVSIILFNAVFKYTGGSEHFTGNTIFKISYEFANLTFYSILAGIIASFTWALLLKHFRFLTHSPIHETLFVFWFGYIGYMVAEVFELSGIITLLSSGIIMSHYAWYNLSPQSKQTTSIAFGWMGFWSEAFIFAYLGLTFFSYSSYDWSWQFLIAEFIVVFVGRFLGVVGLLYAISIIFNHKREVTFKEAIFLFCGGMIRGAIAFGLVLRLDKHLPNRSVIVTTSLWLVLATTLIFGTLLPFLSKILLSPSSEPAKEDEMKELENVGDDNKSNSEGESQSEESFHDLLIHPNFDAGSQTVASGKKKKRRFGCVHYFKKFDEVILRPVLIYKYSKERNEKEYEIYEEMKHQGISVEDVFSERNDMMKKHENKAGNLMQH